MRAFFRHIRTQPKHIRDRYAFSIAATFTGLVLLVWAVARVDAPTTFLAATASSTEPTAFSTLIKNSKEQLASIKAAISSSTATAGQGEAVATTTPQDPKAIVLTPEEITAASEKAASNTPVAEPPPLQYTEVLIGTTSASTTVSASSTAQ